MTTDQYTELIGFLGQKFAGLETRLDDHDRQFDEVRRHAAALFEQARNERRVMMEGLQTRLDVVDLRLEGIDGRLDVVDLRLEGIDGRLDVVDLRLEGIDGRLDGIDRHLDGLNGRR